MANKGFSFIELMAVILIISIIAVFVYPSYRHLITKARRIDGQTALLELANRMEEYYSRAHTYRGATIASSGFNDILSTSSSDQNWYHLKIIEQTDTYFNLHAIPAGAQATADTLCQTFTFNSLGIKGITSGPGGLPLGNSSQCW
ncbi:type IV pilin protein [Legionella micdadei]|uniref:Putative Type IV pilin n=1 Tax=Legionella micdadei TaxID=451 RepID=A0A098GDG9_LEGMI|nr:type IV pilin protein [Legionella micdadei]ARG98899.1 prepilin-type cleavage/methylation domain-containing protein [Legionella micdadei]ARG99810.1 prepilin-type cleavage/methylation domain-containing protein [Legionella micdadei]KTD28588.1 type-IV pilin [Legionella micdadei]NSL19181.1 prepilin-type N-terminal cleavage/methylation domain-containing protein [Legionella micdadei]CEG60519.1 putative Type IV pilin [Legionella micdadei]